MQLSAVWNAVVWKTAVWKTVVWKTETALLVRSTFSTTGKHHEDRP